MAEVSIRDWGAVGDDLTDNAACIQRAIDVCASRGGGRVVVPSGGIFVSGGLELRTGVELHLQPGGVLKASPVFDRHRPLGDLADAFGRDRELSQARCFIQARGVYRLAITGSGVLDGNARAFVSGDLGHIYQMDSRRPRLLLLEGCQGLTVRDVEIRDGAFWTLHPVGCEDVVIDGVRILNDLKVPNCDGIDPDHCRNVRIANCHVEAGDDAIVLKNHPNFVAYGPTENVVVVNCTLVSTSCAFKIGTESYGDFRNIRASNCVIDRSNRGVGIQLRDWGNVENVHFSGLQIRTRLFGELWWGKSEPIALTAMPRRPGDRVGHIRRVVFSQIDCEGEGGILVHADANSLVRDLEFHEVTMRVVRRTRHVAGWVDLRPAGGEEHGGLERAPVDAFRIQGVDSVRLKQCRVQWVVPGGGRPAEWGCALRTQGCHPEEVDLRVLDGDDQSCK